MCLYKNTWMCIFMCRGRGDSTIKFTWWGLRIPTFRWGLYLKLIQKSRGMKGNNLQIKHRRVTAETSEPRGGSGAEVLDICPLPELFMIWRAHVGAAEAELQLNQQKRLCWCWVVFSVCADVAASEFPVWGERVALLPNYIYLGCSFHERIGNWDSLLDLGI